MTEPKWEQPPEPIEPSRVWAEPEAGGEAYLPLPPNQLSRSREIWEQAAANGPDWYLASNPVPKPLRILGLKPQTFVLVVVIALMTMLAAWLGWLFGGLS